MTSPKYIYFYFRDGFKQPLYIGQTNNISTRFTQHKKQNKVFNQVNQIYFITVPCDYTEKQTTLLEYLCIWNCKPSHNSVLACDCEFEGHEKTEKDFAEFYYRGQNLIDTIKAETDGIYFVRNGKIIHFQSATHDFTNKKVMLQ